MRRNVSRSPADLAASIAEMSRQIPRRPIVGSSVPVAGSSTMTPYGVGNRPPSDPWNPRPTPGRGTQTSSLANRFPLGEALFGTGPVGSPEAAAARAERAENAGLEGTPGLTWNDVIGMIVGGGQTSGGGGGGGGRGGYSRPTNPDPLGWGAIQSAQQTEQAYRDMIAAEQRMRESAEARLAGRRTGAGEELAAAKARADALLAELNAANELTQQRVGGVYSAGDAALAQVMMDVENALRTRTAAAGETLGMFGANPAAAMPGGTSAVEFAGAGRANLGQMGTSDLAYFAGRPQAYAGLGMDINTLREAAYQNILNQIAAEEEQIRRDAEQRTAELERQRAQAILEIQQREADRMGGYA